MTEVVLALLGREETASAVLTAAEHLSTLAGRATVMALTVEMPPQAGALVAESLIAEAADAAEPSERDRRRVAALEAVFDAWAAGAREAGVKAQWHRVAGAADSVVEQKGRRADMIVVAQPGADDDAQTRAGFRAALLRSERPVLVVPPGWTASFGRTIAIAWRDDGRAAKAVIPALRFLSGAAQVHILQGTRDGAKHLPVPAVFTDHGIDAGMHVLPIEGMFGRVLLGKAHQLGADLLVMGAYAHNPLREAIFGGVTRYMLEHADLPVLMRH
jgi:nucleotide-binding universal stress UspA family protein